MIEVKDVSFHYPGSKRLVLNAVNLSVQEGEVVAIVGNNGSGKSTLGRLIAGILKLKNGQISIDGLDVRHDREKLKNKVGIVFQNPENQIIFNNIQDELGFALRGLTQPEVERRVHESLTQVGMQDFAEQDLYDLSLGQKQRIMIGEILAKNPQYLILDEPTTMIDSWGKTQIYQIIRQLKRQGYTIICITNLADEILLADRTLILHEGKIAAEIKREDLVDQAELLAKYKIKLPTLLELLVGLRKSGVKLNLADFTVDELAQKLAEKLHAAC